MALTFTSVLAAPTLASQGRSARRLLEAGSVVSRAIADAYVMYDVPTLNTGTSSELVLNRDPLNVALAKFQIDPGADIGRVVVGFHISSLRGGSLRLRGIQDSTWTESSVTFESRPRWGDVVATATKSHGANQWVQFDVSEYVQAPGIYSFALSTTSSATLLVSSRESQQRPYIEVAGSQATTTTSSTSTSAPPPTSSSTTSTTTAAPPPSGGSVTITMSGDLGANWRATAALRKIASIAPDAHFLAGDLSYGEITPESAWCDYVHGEIGTSLPFEVVAGNHEHDSKVDGFIRDFAECMPDKLGARGDYGVQYHVDMGDHIKVIAISPDLDIDGRSYKYWPGTSERRWLEARVAEAKAEGRWVIVVQHKVCITAGNKGCEIGETLAKWLAANVDLVLMGHDHTYQRSHQLSCVEKFTLEPSCIVDTDGDHVAGEGAVFLISGLTAKHRTINWSDSEVGYFAALMGQGDPGWGHGFVQLDITETTLTSTFIGTDTDWSDTFTIRR